MNPNQVVAGILAGAVGAAAWAAISFYGNMEIGYVAWGIGIVVGIAVAAAGRNSQLAGVAAVLITIASLLAGKYAAVELAVQEVKTEIDQSAAEWEDPELEITDEALQSYVANTIAQERKAAGEEIEWPNVVDDEASVEATYPADIWAEAGVQFNGKSDSERATLRSEYIELSKNMTAAFGKEYLNSIRKEGFMASFGVLDLVFFGLAVATAWGIASRDEESGEAEYAEPDENEVP